MQIFKYKKQISKYYCRKINALVKIRRQILILNNFNSKNENHSIREIPIFFDCDEKLKCGICKDACKIISFDWKKCGNPLCIYSFLKK